MQTPDYVQILQLNTYKYIVIIWLASISESFKCLKNKTTTSFKMFKWAVGSWMKAAGNCPFGKYHSPPVLSAFWALSTRVKLLSNVSIKKSQFIQFHI